jgi:hypothetical protein
MAAACEIDGCDVLAVGRCSQCKLAMCESHRAVNLLGAPVVHLCAVCSAARAHEHDERHRDRQRRIRVAREAIRRTAQRLIIAGQEPTEKYFHAKSGKVVRLGNDWIPQGERWTPADNPAGHKYGWYVGTFNWYGLPKGAHIPETLSARPRRTFVTVDGQICAQHTSEEKVPRPAGVDPMAHPDGLVLFLECVAARFEDLAESLLGAARPSD